MKSIYIYIYIYKNIQNTITLPPILLNQTQWWLAAAPFPSPLCEGDIKMSCFSCSALHRPVCPRTLRLSWYLPVWAGLGRTGLLQWWVHNVWSHRTQRVVTSHTTCMCSDRTLRCFSLCTVNQVQLFDSCCRWTSEQQLNLRVSPCAQTRGGGVSGERSDRQGGSSLLLLWREQITAASHCTKGQVEQNLWLSSGATMKPEEQAWCGQSCSCLKLLHVREERKRRPQSVLCLLPPVSCLLSPVSCLLSPVSCCCS